MALFDEKRSGMAKLMSLLSAAALGQGSNWTVLARALANELRSPSLDWRDLARALEQVRNQPSAPGAAGLLERAALLAMRLSDSAAPPKASVDMLDACAPGVAPEQMLRSVVAILQRQIPFDLVSYAEYYHGSEATEGATLVRGRFAMDRGEEFRWPARWVAIPAAIARWAEGKIHWVADSEQFYKENPQAETLRDNPVSREYEKRGARSYLIAPLLDGGGRVKAVLTLARRGDSPDGPFGQADQYKLDTLCMERVVRRVNEAFDLRTQVIAEQIIPLFTPRAAPAVLAQDLVDKLCRGFEWEYVGLFRVNRARDKFELVAEHDAHGKLKVSASASASPSGTYEQDLTAGMLGRTLQEGRPLYVPDVTKKPVPHGYIQVTKFQASALTYPIRMGADPDAEVEWILDLESSQLDAFPQPEQELLSRTVAEVERAVALWFEARLADALLNVVGQGVIVLGGRTRIERANAAARELLGLRKDLELPIKDPTDRRGDLARYAADKTTRELIIGDQVSSAGVHLRLKGADGIERRALAVASYHDEAFHRRVWLLADVEQAQWVGALKYMETAVRAVAAQAHGRLLLARALLRNAQGQLPANSPASALIDRAARNLSGADLPYERIASVFDVIYAPRSRKGLLDLAGELRRFRDSLPQDDADAMELVSRHEPAIVMGDPERLAFAFRSLLGHLLAVRSAPLKVWIEMSGGRASVNILLTAFDNTSVMAGLSETAPDGQAGKPDKIAYVESLAFAVATHAFDAVRAVIKAHRGKLEVAERDGKLLVSVGRLRLFLFTAPAKAAVGEPSGSNAVTE